MLDFHNIGFWKRSHKLVLHFYKATNEFPESEKFGLKSQIRRSAVSVPSNIAEGCGRNSKAQLKNFLQIAVGSLSELQYQNFLSYELKYVSDKEYNLADAEIIEIRKMIHSYSSKL